MAHHEGKTIHAMQIARDEKRKIILASVFCERGDPFMPGDCCKLLGITPDAAAHLLREMSKEGQIEMVQIRNNRGLMVNTYRANRPKILRKAWRRHPNYHPMPSRWQIGAPI
jgi:hypothetical protein